MSLWEDSCVKDAISRMDADTKLKYKRIGEALYDTIDFCDPETITNDYAAQIKFMLRDGLSPSDLTDIERETFISVYGLKCLENYKNDSEHSTVVSKDPGTHFGKEERNATTKEGGKDVSRPN